MFKVMKTKGLVIFFGILTIGIFFNNPANAQTAATPEEMFQIPPMRVLIDSALRHSPLLKTKDLEIAVRDIEWRALRWEWADMIQPFAEYRYGTVDNYLVVNQNVVDAQQTQAHRFSIGGRINFTLFNAVNTKYKQKIAEKQIEIDAARRKEIEQLVTQEIIRLYTLVVTYREIVFLKSEHMQTQAINLAEAKLRYETGEVPIMELARITEIETKAKEEYQLAVKEFREATYLLQELVGGGDFTNWSIRKK